MPNIKVWCLLIDHEHKPTFGEPFPVDLNHDDTIHQLKIKIRWGPNSDDLHGTANRIEIWKCKSLKLSAKDSFDQTKEQLGDNGFSGDWNSHFQHFGVAQRVMELQLEDELLLAIGPRKGARYLFLCSMFLTELPMSNIA